MTCRWKTKARCVPTSPAFVFLAQAGRLPDALMCSLRASRLSFAIGSMCAPTSKTLKTKPGMPLTSTLKISSCNTFSKPKRRSGLRPLKSVATTACRGDTRCSMPGKRKLMCGLMPVTCCQSLGLASWHRASWRRPSSPPTIPQPPRPSRRPAQRCLPVLSFASAGTMLAAAHRGAFGNRDYCRCPHPLALDVRWQLTRMRACLKVQY